ncbi:MAG: transcription antitermination factor NusB [Cyanobacteriota bacterium]
MKARRVARELALLSLSQVGKNIKSLQESTIEDLIINAVRTLSEYSLKNLKNTMTDLMNIKEVLEEEELNDPENLSTPIEADIKPIEIPKSDLLKSYVDTMFNSAESILQAIELTEMSALTKKKEITNYSIKLVQCIFENADTIDSLIDLHSDGWQLDRILKLDKNILRLAVAEMKYMNDVPMEVSIDEAVELVKKYSSEESPKFINGVLGQIYNALKESDS